MLLEQRLKNKKVPSNITNTFKDFIIEEYNSSISSEFESLQKSLLESETRYQTLVDNLPIGVYRSTSDSPGRFLRVNIAMAEMLGYDSVEDLMKINISESYANPADRERFVEIVKESKIAKNLTIYLKRKDGKRFWASDTSLAKYNEKGEIEWIEGICEDVTKRKKLEERLLETERRYEALFHRSNDAVFIIDFNGTIIDFNKKACDLLGYSKDELLNMNTNRTVASREYSDSKKKRNHMKYYDFHPIYQRTFLRKDGTEFIGEINLSLVRDAEGKPLHIQSIVRDITKRKQEEKVRMELDSRRKRFIEITSHELRTPMTVIQGFIGFLQDKCHELSEKQINDSFKHINKNINRLNRLINEVSDISRLERDIFELHTEIIDLASLVEERIISHKRLFGEQIEFHYNLTESPLLVKVDKYRIHQVLDNLIDNAIKNTPKDERKIDVTITSPSPNLVRIIISDNGAGIEQQHLEKIFEPFISLGSKYSTIGSGIGLFLCRTYIEKHNGTIFAKSEGEDKGSSFIIDLPRIVHI